MRTTILDMGHPVTRTRFVLPALLGLFLFQANSEAQVTSRAELLEAERQAKVEELAPPQRTTIERGMRFLEKAAGRFENIRGKEQGFHYRAGDFPSGAGMGFGVGYTYNPASKGGYPEPDRPNLLDFTVGTAYSTRDYYELKTEVQWRNIGGSIVNLAWRANYHENPEEDFFGMGSESQRKDRTNYLYRSLEGGSDVWLAPIKGLRVGSGVSYVTPRTGSGRDPRYASLETVFDPDTVPGFRGEPDFLRVNAYVDYDRRDNPSYPRSGTFLGAKFSNYSDRHLDQFNFRSWEFDAQQYLRFDDGYKVLAVGGNVVMTDGPTGSVPFYFMPDLGGGQRLRGFREFRFRDRNSVLATAEYRWEAWWPLDVALFADTGKVASRKADINFKGLELGYGIGFRLHSKKNFVFRLDLAGSREGFVPIFSAKHVF